MIDRLENESLVLILEVLFLWLHFYLWFTNILYYYYRMLINVSTPTVCVLQLKNLGIVFSEKQR